MYLKKKDYLAFNKIKNIGYNNNKNKNSQNNLSDKLISNKKHLISIIYLNKIQRADVTCDVIRKVAPLVLSKL